jgi:hypothetical protein
MLSLVLRGFPALPCYIENKDASLPKARPGAQHILMIHKTFLLACDFCPCFSCLRCVPFYALGAPELQQIRTW